MKKEDILFCITIILIFIMGLYLRLNLYLFNRPLWHDECSLALSIINRNIFGYFGLLEHNQSAPSLFMVFTKLNSMLFGIKEYSLRLIPFICGILSVPVFYFFSKLFICKRLPLLFANFLFAINYYLIYYSQEFKQYSSDVLLFMLGIIFIVNIDIREFSNKKLLILGGVLGLLPMLSVPLCFVVSGYILFQLIVYQKSIFKKILVVLVPIIVLWSINWFSVILPEHIQKLNYFRSFWDNGFISLNIFQIFKFIKMNLSYYLYPNNFIFGQLILIMIGIYYLIKNNKDKVNIFLGCVLIFIILASFFRIYPIYERVSLYLIPLILISIVLPFNYVDVKKRIITGFFMLLLIMSICKYNLSYFKGLYNTNTFMRYDSRAAMQNLISQYKNSKSFIIVNIASDSEFGYYKKYYGFNPENVLYMQLPNYSKNNYFMAMDMLPNGYDYWFYYVFDYSHSPVIPFLKEYSLHHLKLYELDSNGTYILHLQK